MPTIQRAFLIALFLVAAGAVPLSHAQAASTVLGATVCVTADVVGGAGSGLLYSSGGVSNVSGRQADIICSLFRDNPINTNGMQDLELSISDPSTGPGGFICDALSLDRKGSTKKVVRRTNTAVGESVLDWGGSVNVSVSKGYYLVRCSVPNGGWIRSIYYLEP
jgi:hypothetical protein